MKTPTTLAAISCFVATLLPGAYSASIDIVVGGPGLLKYNPQFVTANPGDIVRFIFQQKNHTATQSTFEQPCVHAQDGFDSGFVPVPDNQTSRFPVAEFNVHNTSPVWVYCKQGNHCQQGMVFAINPGDKFSAFQNAATGTISAPTTTSSPAGTGVTTVTATVTVSGQPLTTTYGSYPGSAAPTAATATNHKVVVGGLDGKLTYDPSNITAQAGDTVTFEFRQKNHTITASSFAAPCRALSSTTGEPGFDSGFIPVADNATIFPNYTITINNTMPIWAYCRQPGHCGHGMVFSVNAIESGPNNFSAFQAKAIQMNGTNPSQPQPKNNGAFKSYGFSRLVLLALFLFGYSV